MEKDLRDDLNGNLSRDGRDGLAYSNNILNLPGTISDGMDETRITYLADGTKTGVAGRDGTWVKYRGSFVYEKPSAGAGYKLSSVLWDEGMIHCSDSTVTDAIFVRDHLGSVRSVVNLSAPASATVWDAILETRDYLPFGTEAVSTTGAAYVTWPQNRWRYEGKETLPFTPAPSAVKDFGARYYDPYTARWLSADPKSWDYTTLSPYAFCAGDPVGIVDIHGDVPFAIFYKDKIVIIAKYRYNAVSKESLSQALEFWNSRKDLVYKDSSTGKQYSITFRLSGVFDKDMYDSQEKMNTSSLSENEYYYHVSSVRLMGIRRTGSNYKRDINVREDYSITRPDTSVESTTGAHEIGHSLGMNHKPIGIMTESQSDNRTSDVLEENINEMINQSKKFTANNWLQFVFMLNNNCGQ